MKFHWAFFVFAVSLSVCDVWCQAPTETTLDIDCGTITDIYIGQVIPITVSAKFVPGTTVNDVSIELLPSTTELVMAFGSSPTSSKNHAELSITGNISAFVTHTYEDSTTDLTADIVQYDTRVVLELGDVSATSNGYELTVTYEVVFVSLGSMTDGATYWLSAGEAYTEGGNDYIWISQCDVIVHDVNSAHASATADPTFTFDPNSTIVNGVGHVTSLTMEIPRPRTAVTVEVAVLNTTRKDIFVQELKVTSVGSAYSYMFQVPNAVVKAWDKCPLVSHLVLDLGTLINKESQTASPNTADFQIVVEVVLHAASAPFDDVIDLSIGVDFDGTEIYLAPFSVTVSGGTPASIDSFTVSPTTENIEVGGAATASIDLTIPANTMQELSITISSAPQGVFNSALSILSVSPTEQGTGVLCGVNPQDTSIQLHASGVSHVFDSAVYTAKVTNFNWPAGSSANIKLTVAVMVVDNQGAVDGNQHVLDVSVNGMPDQTVIFTVNGTASYPSNLNFDFNISHSCSSDTFLSGSILHFLLDVTTQRNVVAGPFTLEAPIPTDIANARLAIVGSSVINKGPNVACAPIADLSLETSDWKNGSGDNDRGVMRLPLMCNIQAVDDVSGDLMQLRVAVRLKDVPDLVTSDTSDTSVGMGIMFSENNIWTGSYTVSTVMPKSTATPVVLTGISVPDADVPTEFPGDWVVEWSPDNVKYYPSYVNFNTSLTASSAGDTTFSLERPLLGRYFRLVNSAGSCPPSDYSIVTKSTWDAGIFSYGPKAKLDAFFQPFGLVLDGDVETCVPLPSRNSTDTPQRLWVTMTTEYLGHVNQSMPFNVTLVGHGITCENRTADQVTVVSHPKSGNADVFQGRRPKCRLVAGGDVTDPVVTTRRSCTYMCACSDVSSCSEFNVMMHHKATTVPSAEDYKLCSIDVSV
ncbi:uncharacterized protein LOC128215779 [Mya arenaria]|uniref:uncharacterized protein LOC128215779 n=1 Tax=Mya arenaria TaxID=6604 RepID=UPI0022E6D526|nr:uncharacterized protein LOC128215779 [Mya arenaria]